MPLKKKKILTPEEKLARKLKRREARKLSAALKRKKIHHNYLQREIHYGYLTKKNHEKEWNHMLTKATLPKIRDDLEFAWQYFERVMDVKDFTISLHMDEVDFAQEQYMMSNRRQFEDIEQVMHLFKDHLKDIQADFDQNVSELRAEAFDAATFLKNNYHEDEVFFKIIRYGLEQIGKEFEKNVKGNFLVKFDEEAHRYEEQTFLHATNLQRIYDIWFVEASKFVKNVFESTKGRRVDYFRLLLQDQSLKEIQIAQTHRIMLMQKKIKKSKDRFLNLQKIKIRKINSLKSQKVFLTEIYLEIKNMLMTQNAKFKKMFEELTTKSNYLLDCLMKFQKKGEQALQIVSMNRKFEREKEHVLPFPRNKPCDMEEEHLEYKDVLMQAGLHKYAELRYFWIKVGNVARSEQQLQQEKEYLIQENKKLKKAILSHCKCLSCPSLPPIHPKKSYTKLPVIDGKSEMKKYRV